MKDIGRTREGNYLVELNNSEYDTLVYLERAMQGETLDTIRHGMNRDYANLDLSDAFKAIRLWVQGMCYVNSLQDYTDKLKEMMKK